jgi:N-acetylglucosaminylphosphatidylinositol deacetylase
MLTAPTPASRLLQDGFGQRWDPILVSALVRERVRRFGAQAIATFDEGGISGHPNHVAVHHGVGKYARAPGAVPCYELRSVGTLRKYCGPLDAFISALAPGVSAAPVALQGGRVVPGGMLLTSCAPWRSHWAMAAHWSQYVWFRRLFVIFSRYTWVNSLALMRASRD